MSRQALYRLYRPRAFGEVVGQPRSVAVLQEAVRRERLSHAYLFSGPRGTGKTSVARILAKAVNCLARGEDGEPCLQCASCTAVEQATHLDVIEIDAASNRGIDDIRDIKERVQHSPVMGTFKVYIIDEVHMLTKEAFNALLKILEEPPRHVMFILATTEMHKVPLTVLSRCQRYQFERLRPEVIAERLGVVLEREGEAFEPEALALLADAADGALRDALSLTDKVLAMGEIGEGLTRASVSRFLGGLSDGVLAALLDALTAPDLAPLLAVIDQAYGEGADVREMLRDVARGIRDLVVFQTLGGERLPAQRRDLIAACSARIRSGLTGDDWFRVLEALAEAEEQLRGGMPPRLVAEMALFRAREALKGGGSARTEAVSTSPRAVPPEPPGEAAPVSVTARPPADFAAAEEPSGPDPEGFAASRSGRFSRVLDSVRRERPSTFALLQYAEVAEKNDRVTIWFQFPAHRDLLMQPANREILDEIFHRVYGPEMGYDLVSGDDERPTNDSVPKSEPLPLKARVLEVFGAGVRLEGFREGPPTS